MFGPHLMLDMYGCSKEQLRDVNRIGQVLGEMPGRIGMTKISEPHVIYYPGKGESFDKGGVTGFVFLAESHISIHTFAREGFVSVDIFSCKEFNMEEAEKFLMETFNPKKVERNLIVRGTDFVKRYPTIQKSSKAKRNDL
ncbi:MAG: adenosylmethionine decarboxylase [Candidatus Aenigmarchaeota archaeon]|nr:adenosylmethionine decarboxylase [Candidatus Aenigmarchaeota archaeon]